MDQGSLVETNEARIDSTEAKNPNEADGEENGANESLKVEILHGTKAGVDGNKPV